MADGKESHHTVEEDGEKSSKLFKDEVVRKLDGVAHLTSSRGMFAPHSPPALRCSIMAYRSCIPCTFCIYFSSSLCVTGTGGVIYGRHNSQYRMVTNAIIRLWGWCCVMVVVASQGNVLFINRR